MKNGLNVIAVVPARGGDPEVPYLNIKKLGTIPLIAHTLEEAKKSKYIDRLIVSTDDDQVERVAREYDAEVVRRPDELAQNISQIREVIRHAVETVETDTRFDIVVSLQATSPFRRAEQIDAAIDELVDNEFDGVISLKEVRTLTWHRPQDKLEPLFARAGRRDEAPLPSDRIFRTVAAAPLAHGKPRCSALASTPRPDEYSGAVVASAVRPCRVRLGPGNRSRTPRRAVPGHGDRQGVRCR